MKKINKAAQPTDLRNWAQENAQAPQNLVYGQAQFPHTSVLRALLEEQGFICAYTLKRLCPSSSHVEHLKPQTLCRNEDTQRETKGDECLREDIAWNNIVACFPSSNPPAPPDYGAVKKKSWWDPVQFVSPLQEDCELRFKFTSDGGIAAANSLDTAAIATIENIGLDNDKLSELRETAYKRAGIHRRSERPIRSVTKVERLIAGWMHKHRETGAYPEFCVPLIQVAKEYAQFLRQQGTAV